MQIQDILEIGFTVELDARYFLAILCAASKSARELQSLDNDEVGRIVFGTVLERSAFGPGQRFKLIPPISPQNFKEN